MGASAPTRCLVPGPLCNTHTCTAPARGSTYCRIGTCLCRHALVHVLFNVGTGVQDRRLQSPPLDQISFSDNTIALGPVFSPGASADTGGGWVSNWNSSADEVPSDGAMPPHVHHLSLRPFDLSQCPPARSVAQ